MLSAFLKVEFTKTLKTCHNIIRNNDKLSPEADARNAKIACIKYSFVYNNVKVNIYFDMFDKQMPSLNLVLIYKKKYYFIK